MKFTTRHLGSYGGNPSKIIELTIEGWNNTITEDVTDLKGNVDEDFILSLRNIADELEEHNEKLKDHERQS